MSKTVVYDTTVQWKGAHRGHVFMGNGPDMPFSAPPDAQGHAGVLTPEDAYVASINTCIMMMFVWAAERFWPQIRVAANGAKPEVIERRIEKALQSAQKYSLVANSVKSEVVVEPTVEVV